MIIKYFCIILLSFPILTFAAELFKFLNLPQHDGVNRVCQLNSAAVDTNQLIVDKSNGLLLIVTEASPINNKNKKQQCSDDWAEVTAQLLIKRNITVCEYILKSNEVSDIGTVGDVVIYLNGKKQIYYGRKSPTALLSYLLKYNTPQINVITGKLDKVAYDKVPGPKVVGFFMQGTPDYAAFEAAALQHSPSIPFYVAYDRVVAKHLKLTTVGEIHLVRFTEKSTVVCPANPATALDIDAFINSNKAVILKHLNEHNIHDPLLYDSSKTTFLAIGEQSSAIGGYFYKLVTKVIRNVTQPHATEPTPIDSGKSSKSSKSSKASKSAKVTAPQTATAVPTPAPEPAVMLDNVDILWLDPQVFPTVYVMMDQLERLFGFPPGLPFYFGAVNITANQSVWFNSALINTTADKQSDDANVILLRDWIISVVNKVIQPSTIGVQQFLKEPISVRPKENSDFILECEVQSQVGDCLWLHDGQNIGFNLVRHAPHYSWRGNNGNGDCSLMVKGAIPERDNGEWVCEVTGDLINPTITSLPAIVSVTPEPKTTEPITKNEL